MQLLWFRSIKVVLWNKNSMSHNVIVGYVRCWGQMHLNVVILVFCPLKLNSLFHTTSFFTSRVEFITLVDFVEMKQNVKGRHWRNLTKWLLSHRAIWSPSGSIITCNCYFITFKISSPRKISRADDIHYKLCRAALTNAAETHWVIHSDKWSVVNISRRRKEFYFN